MPFNSHLLLPEPQDFTPSSVKVLTFFNYLSEMGALALPVTFRLRIASDEDLYARNAKTGEKILLGKRLKDVPLATLDEVQNHLQASTEYVLSARSTVPIRFLPFDAYETEGEQANLLSECELSVTCVLRNQRTQLSEPWHEHMRVFLLPREKAANACEQCGAIHTPEEEVRPRFWIEFSLGGVFLPSFKDSDVPMNSEVFTRIEAIFETQFFHGRTFD